MFLIFHKIDLICLGTPKKIKNKKLKTGGIDGLYVGESSINLK
jgi:hypothetical protein